MCLALHRRLQTQDVVSKWMNEIVLHCPLCSKTSDSVPHLFFECDYSKRVWESIKGKIIMDSATCDWDDIIGKLKLMHSKNNIKSILRKAGVAPCVYAIWRERNLRIFQDKKRTEEVVTKEITEDIKWKLSGFTVKKSKDVSIVYEDWDIRPSYAKMMCDGWNRECVKDEPSWSIQHIIIGGEATGWNEGSNEKEM
ncbi:reverse transcriptase zinc-binding domain-containing protein [Tanacetum coccineum]